MKTRQQPKNKLIFLILKNDIAIIYLYKVNMILNILMYFMNINMNCNVSRVLICNFTLEQYSGEPNSKQNYYQEIQLGRQIPLASFFSFYICIGECSTHPCFRITLELSLSSLPKPSQMSGQQSDKGMFI